MQNVGGIDRILRIVVGIALVATALVVEGAVWGWIGVVPLATGLMGWCPAYAPLKFTTRKGGTGTA